MILSISKGLFIAGEGKISDFSVTEILLYTLLSLWNLEIFYHFFIKFTISKYLILKKSIHTFYYLIIIIFILHIIDIVKLIIY